MIATIVLLLSLGKHGEPKEGKYNFWVSLVNAALIAFLYYKAGLFNNFNI